MTREAEVVRSLVEMAGTLVEDYDVVDLLTGLADRCVDLLGVSAAGVMLASPAGSLGLVASSSEAMRLLELLRAAGPGGPVPGRLPRRGACRPREPAGRAGRWPSFSAAALEAGFASASALPLRLREVTLGALNLLSVTQAPMDEADLIVARAFADLATLSITQHRASAEAQRLNGRPVRRPDQPGGDRAGQGGDLRAGRRRPGRGFHPAAGLRPHPQPAPHRCRPGRHRRHPGSRGLGRLPRGSAPAGSPRGQRRWPHRRRSRGDHLRWTWRNRPGVVARRVRGTSLRAAARAWSTRCWIFPRCGKARAWRRHSGSAIASHCSGFSSAVRTSVPAQPGGAPSWMRAFRLAARGSTAQGPATGQAPCQ